MKANRFISLSLDLWHNPKVLGLVQIRRGDDPMLTTGRFIRFMGLLYEYHGCIDWSDAVVRAVVSSELGMQEDECGAFVSDLVKVGFLETGFWESDKHAISKGVSDELAYRKSKEEAGKRSAESRRNKSSSK